MLGAGRVIAIDRVPERLEMAREHGKAETINFDEDKVYDKLMEMTDLVNMIDDAAMRVTIEKRSAALAVRKLADHGAESVGQSNRLGHGAGAITHLALAPWQADREQMAAFRAEHR